MVRLGYFFVVGAFTALIPDIDFVVERVSVKAHRSILVSFLFGYEALLRRWRSRRVDRRGPGLGMDLDDFAGDIGEAEFVIHGEAAHAVVSDIFRNAFFFHHDALCAIDDLSVLQLQLRVRKFAS